MGFIRFLLWFVPVVLLLLKAVHKERPDQENWWRPLKFKWLNIALVPVAIVIGIFIGQALTQSVKQVPAGHKGVLLMGKGATGKSFDEGYAFVLPFVQDIANYNVQQQSYEMKGITAASLDQQNVFTAITVIFKPQPTKAVDLYRMIGPTVEDIVRVIIAPNIPEVVKAVTARYKADELLQKRDVVKAQITEELSARYLAQDVVTIQVNITDFQFSEGYSAAIEEKAITIQQLETARRRKEIADQTAQATVITAKGDAEAMRIKTAAINSQGGKDYVALQAITQWDGHLPQIVGGGTVPFINIDALKGGK